MTSHLTAICLERVPVAGPLLISSEFGFHLLGIGECSQERVLVTQCGWDTPPVRVPQQ